MTLRNEEQFYFGVEGEVTAAERVNLVALLAWRQLIRFTGAARYQSTNMRSVLFRGAALAEVIGAGISGV